MQSNVAQTISASSLNDRIIMSLRGRRTCDQIIETHVNARCNVHGLRGFRQKNVISVDTMPSGTGFLCATHPYFAQPVNQNSQQKLILL